MQSSPPENSIATVEFDVVSQRAGGVGTSKTRSLRDSRRRSRSGPTADASVDLGILPVGRSVLKQPILES